MLVPKFNLLGRISLKIYLAPTTDWIISYTTIMLLPKKYFLLFPILIKFGRTSSFKEFLESGLRKCSKLAIPENLVKYVMFWGKWCYAKI